MKTNQWTSFSTVVSLRSMSSKFITFLALGSMTFTECNKLYYDEKRRLGSSELTMNTICNSKRVQMSTVRHAASISKMVDIKF